MSTSNMPLLPRNLLRHARRSHLVDFVLFAFVVLAMLALIRLLPEPVSRDVEGRARVLDGDSLRLDGLEIRLRGIDAPEVRQACGTGAAAWPCGRESARRLRALVRGRVVACSGNRTDRHGRLLALCRTDGREINRWLVENGWAVSFDAYPSAERAARRAGRGIWAGAFERPSEWRKRTLPSR